jgi:adenylate kinase
MLNIVIFGPPGCGKGTQSANLVKEFNLVHLSTGDIFRANINGNTELGLLAKSYMDKGNLVPDEVTISMLEAVVNQNPNASGFIFDGFPRNTAQAEALDNFLASKGTSVTLMLALEVEDEELKRRILERGKISGRADDQDPVIVENRIKVYNEQTAPLIGYYASQSKSYAVDGQVSVTEVFDSLCFAIRRATEKAAPKKAAKPVAKKTVKKVAPKKAAKPVAKKAAKKAAPKKAAKPVAKKAVKKAAPKKAAKPVAKKAVKKAAPKRAAKPVAKKTVKKVAPKKAAKPVAKKAAKKVAPKKAAKPVAKKAAKKVAPKKAAKPAVKKAVKKAAPKKTAKPVAKKAVKKAAKKGRK